MLPRFLIPYLQIGHGLFNLSLFAIFVYQGWLGWVMRRNRQAGSPPEVAKVRRHRALGPFLAALMPIGYLAGLLLSYLDYGVWTQYPFHLAGGSLLVTAVTATWFISRQPMPRAAGNGSPICTNRPNIKRFLRNLSES